MYVTQLIEVAARELRSGHVVHQDGERFVVTQADYASADQPVLMNGCDGLKCAVRIYIAGRLEPTFAYPSARLSVEKFS